MVIAGKQCNSSAVHDESQTQYDLQYIVSSQWVFDLQRLAYLNYLNNFLKHWHSCLPPYQQTYLEIKPYPGVCLYSVVICAISDSYPLKDFMNYFLLMWYDTQWMHEISYRLESTDCICTICWYVHHIVINCSEDIILCIAETYWPDISCNT